MQLNKIVYIDLADPLPKVTHKKRVRKWIDQLIVQCVTHMYMYIMNIQSLRENYLVQFLEQFCIHECTYNITFIILFWSFQTQSIVNM